MRLHLVLTHEWYHQTFLGNKRIEYRQKSERWMKQIYDRRGEITHVRFSRGYSKRTISFRVTKIDLGPCPIEGWDGEYIRIHFE